jgi:hypothetical protein
MKYYKDNIYKENDTSTHLNLFIASGYDRNLYFFQGTETFFFSYIHFKSVKRRIKKVILYYLDRYYLLFDYCHMSLFNMAYKNCSFIIERDNIEGIDVIMSLGRFALITIILLKLPLTYNFFIISFFEFCLDSMNITNTR